MPLIRPALSALMTLAFAATTLAGLAAPAPAATSTGEIVLPPFESLDVPKIGFVTGGDAGLVWQKNNEALHYLPTGTTTPRTADPVWSQHQVTLSGEHLMYRLGYAYVPDGNGDERTAYGPVVDVDVKTGVRRELSHDANDVNAFEHFQGGTDDWWLEQQANGDVVRRTADATLRTYARPADDATSVVFRTSSSLALDNAGVVEFWSTNSGPNFAAYLDFATGTWTKLFSRDVAPKAADHLAMTASTIAWPVGSTLYWRERSAPGVVHSRDLGTPIVDLAMAGNRVAVATQATGSPIVIKLGTLAGAFTTVTAPMPVQAQVVPIGGGGLGVVAGQSTANYGVYRLVPGSTELGSAVLLFGANPPTYIRATVGQLEVGALRAYGDPVVRTIAVSTDAQHHVTTLKAGNERVLESAGLPSNCSRSGAYTVCTKYRKGTYLEEVRQNGRLVGRYTSASGTAQLVERGLLLNQTSYSELIDLQTGASTKLPVVSAVTGDTIYFVTATGEIRGRDLGTGVETVIRSAGLPAPNTDFRSWDYTVEVQGDWMRWFINRDYVPGKYVPGGGAAESVAMNLITHQRVDLTGIDPSTDSYPAARFAAGVVAWVDDATAVHVLDLTTGTATVVGSTGRHSLGQAMTLTSEWVAWMVADGSVHVRPLRDVQAGVPKWSGTVAAPTFSAAAEPYTPVGRINRPLDAWTMSVRAASGTKVRMLTGSAPTGEVAPVWDGKDSKGHVVPDGVYTWTLTGTGPGGALQTSGAASKTVTGTVTVDSTTPTPRFAAPAKGKTTGIALRWKSSEKHVTFTVKVSVGTKDKHGVWRFAKAKTWLRGVPQTSATYVNGKTTPVDLKKGHEYRFTTTATDLAGNTASRTRTVAVG